MENIKLYLYSIFDKFIPGMMNFFVYWLMQTPLKSINIIYSYIIAATIIFIVFAILLISLVLFLSLIFETAFCEGNNISEKYKNAAQKWKNRITVRRREYPDSFMYRYTNQLSFMMISIFIITAIGLKDMQILWCCIPNLVLVILHDHRMRKRFNYELSAVIDPYLSLIGLFITIILVIHFLIIPYKLNKSNINSDMNSTKTLSSVIATAVPKTGAP